MPVAAICSGDALLALPTTSLNGITGSWAPALNNSATTTYTFTPNAGQCATTTTLIITVNPNITPTFNAVAAICSGGALTALPTTSLNGITGTWSPALNNTATTTYTFTPTAGLCATTTTLTITVNPNVTPTFTPVAAILFWGNIDSFANQHHRRHHRNLGTGIKQYGNYHLYVYTNSRAMCDNNDLNHYC